MSMTLKEFEAHINTLLSVKQFKDYCPNGLQVEACDSVSKVVFGVTASEALIDEAIAINADAIVVHHGYFWKGEQQEITGIKAKRIQKLMNNI